MLHPLTMIKQVLWKSQPLLHVLLLAHAYRWLLPLLRILYLCQRLLPRSLIYHLLLLLRILCRIRDLPYLYLRLIIVHSFDYLVVTDLPGVFRGEWVDAVIATKVLELIFLPSPLFLPQLSSKRVNLLLQRLLLQQPLMLHVMHVLYYPSFFLDADPQKLKRVI